MTTNAAEPIPSLRAAKATLRRQIEYAMGDLESAHQEALETAAVNDQAEIELDSGMDDFETDLDEDEFMALLPFVDSEGGRRIVVTDRSGDETVDVRERCLDSLRGEGLRTVRVRYELGIDAYVLGLRIDGENYVGRLSIVGGGHYES